MTVRDAEGITKSRLCRTFLSPLCQEKEALTNLRILLSIAASTSTTSSSSSSLTSLVSSSVWAVESRDTEVPSASSLSRKLSNLKFYSVYLRWHWDIEADLFLLISPLMSIGRVTGKTDRQTASWLNRARAVNISPAENRSVSRPL